MLNTLQENMRFLSPRQQLRAKKARKLYEAMGTPTVDDLKAMIRMNLIRNNEVTTDDINLATKAYGPDIGAIKGKTTRSRTTPVTSSKIEIPEELINVQKEVALSIDGLNVNSLNFSTTISQDIYYRTAQYVQQRKAHIYEKCIQEIDDIYTNGGFQINEIHCDNEFRTSMNSFTKNHARQIKINYTSAKEHVPRAERNNRTIQERIRATYHRLPYEHLPCILVKYLVSELARKLNFFPAKHGVSKHYSPRMILHQENLDYAQHGIHTFGEYVLGHDEPHPSNTLKARALDCIYL